MSSETVAKREMGGLYALYDCAQHARCSLHERFRAVTRTSKNWKRERFVVNDGRGYAFADARRWPTVYLDRSCQRNPSVGRLGSVVANVRKTREFVDSAKIPLFLARDCRGKHNTGTSLKAPYMRCYDVCQCPRIARLALDGRFSKSSSVVAKRRVDGFGAPFDCALHDDVAGTKRFRVLTRTSKKSKRA
jgi:hypothetical protein